VSSGPVGTSMIRSLEAEPNPAGPASEDRRYQSAIPIGRYVTPDEIANTVLFLCSDLASAITGAQYIVDGARARTAARTPPPGRPAAYATTGTARAPRPTRPYECECRLRPRHDRE